jgi:dihydroorotate dehydrogenase (fumarate)
MTAPADLSTRYLTFPLPHPFIIGASPLGDRLDTVRQIEDAGWAAIVLRSVFEEQITAAETGHVRHLDPLDEQFAPIVAYFPGAEQYAFGPDEYLEHLRRVKAAVRIPVIASVNGTSAERWLLFARDLEQAGADAVELNTYEIATGPLRPGSIVEHEILDMIRELRRLLTIPLAVKLTPFFTAFGHFAREVDAAGAAGLVMFNRFYQPDFDIEKLAITTSVQFSTSAELLLRLRWTSLLHRRVAASLAICGGVAHPADGIKAVLAGAHAMQMVSAVLQNGVGYVQTMRDALEHWMERHRFVTLDEVRGRLSAFDTRDPAAFERASYIRTLTTWNR